MKNCTAPPNKILRALTKLFYYEILRDAESAISIEKQIKGGSRQKKAELIEGMNPQWRDLYEEL